MCPHVRGNPHQPPKGANKSPRAPARRAQPGRARQMRERGHVFQEKGCGPLCAEGAEQCKEGSASVFKPVSLRYLGATAPRPQYPPQNSFKSTSCLCGLYKKTRTFTRTLAFWDPGVWGPWPPGSEAQPDARAPPRLTAHCPPRTAGRTPFFDKPGLGCCCTVFVQQTYSKPTANWPAVGLRYVCDTPR
jgi:hypothetical protein